MSAVSDESNPEKKRLCLKAEAGWMATPQPLPVPDSLKKLERLHGPCSRADVLNVSLEVFKTSVAATVNHPEYPKYSKTDIGFFVGWFEQIYLRLEYLVENSQYPSFVEPSTSSSAAAPSTNANHTADQTDGSKPLDS